MLRRLAAKLLNVSKEEIEIPPIQFGDVAYACFKLARELRKNPELLAEELAKKVEKSKLIKKVEAKKGYVNFFLNWNEVFKQLQARKFLKFKKRKAKIVLDFSSPNPIHPIHVGSARSTLIGESLARIFELLGFSPVRVCYLNDLGKQVAILVGGYLKFFSGKKPTTKPDHWLLDVYVKANEELGKNPEFEKEVDRIVYLCEKKDKKIFSVAKKLVDFCLQGFKQTYKRIGISFDLYLYESDFVNASRKLVQKLRRKGIAREENGAVLVDLEKLGLGRPVLLRSDGTGLYLTRDLAASIFKLRRFKPKLNLYVVAEDQRLHFLQEFKLLELLGYKTFARKSFHVAYGFVNLPEGRMASRLGRVVLFDDLLDKAKQVARSYSEEEEVCEKVGRAGIIYSLLKVSPEKQILFKLEDALKLEGDTGPYLQYTYVRCRSLLRKAKSKKEKKQKVEINQEERELLRTLAQLPEVVEAAAKSFQPNLLCSYAYKLATSFNTFYEKHPVLKAKEPLRSFRIELVKLVQEVLGTCLWLLCLPELEKM